MANDLYSLSYDLLQRFKEVPGVTEADTENWMKLSFLKHGYDSDEIVDQEDKLLVLLYAEADGVTQVALRTSYYFQYKDNDETVDKTKVSTAYRVLSKELWDRYFRAQRENEAIRTSSFRQMPRADR